MVDNKTHKFVAKKLGAEVLRMLCDDLMKTIQPQ